MNIFVNDRAAVWYKEEMLLNKGDYIRFFARYGGCSTVQQGFSLGVSSEVPHQIGFEVVKDDIHYYIEEKDLWYFDGKDLYVDFNEQVNEPVFRYE
jgi:uncharacterized protein YneR